MLQPVYIFIIFVLKKNVITIMLGKDKKKMATSRTRTKKTGVTSLRNISSPTTSIRSGPGDKIEMAPIIKQ